VAEHRTRCGGIVVVALLAIAASFDALAADHTVVIDAMAFKPATLTIKTGDRVVFQNQDLVPHTATAPGRFDSGVIQTGASWSVDLKTAGRYDYVCLLHPSMKAVLVVR
jgi:plastocyanin